LSGIDADMSLRDLAVTAERAAEKRGLSPIPQFTGHVIGRQLHEAPIVPFTSSALSGSENGSRIRLLPGTVINVEPVYRPQAGAELGVVKDENGWSYRTADGARTYHFEVTIVMEEKGASVLQFNGRNTRRLPEAAPFGEITGVRAGVGWKD
jgi:methionyl aminopeptidase